MMMKTSLESDETFAEETCEMLVFVAYGWSVKSILYFTPRFSLHLHHQSEKHGC
jgi:hypothetical protein